MVLAVKWLAHMVEIEKGLVQAQSNAMQDALELESACRRYPAVALLAGVALLMRRGEDVHLDVEVSVDELYEGAPKRVVVSVVRAPLFTRCDQELLLALADRPERHDPLPAVHVFSGMGSDSAASMLLGDPSLNQRGDVIVQIRVLEHPTFNPDPVLYPCDLHCTLAVDLVARFYGATVRIGHLSGRELTATYDPHDDEFRQARIFKGLGLPFAGGAERGDLCVFLELALPRRIDAERVLELPHVRAALEELSSCAAVDRPDASMFDGGAMLCSALSLNVD